MIKKHVFTSILFFTREIKKIRIHKLYIFLTLQSGLWPALTNNDSALAIAAPKKVSRKYRVNLYSMLKKSCLFYGVSCFKKLDKTSWAQRSSDQIEFIVTNVFLEYRKTKDTAADE